MSTFINNMFGFTSNYYEMPDYNIKISNIDDGINIEEITRLENVEEYYSLYETADNKKLNIYDLDKVQSKEYLNLEEDETGELKPVDYIGMQIIGLNDEAFKKYAKKIDVSYEKAKRGGILVDSIECYMDGEIIKQRVYSYEEKDTIVGKYGIENAKNMSVKIEAVTEVKPYGYENYSYYGGYLVVDIDYFKEVNFVLDVVSIQASDADKLEESIKKINSDVYVTNLEERVREERAMAIVTKIFLYGFLGVITLIGVTNIFNTITSNMELRQKEFAMLKSIGMTKKEFNRMVNLETVFYGTKSLFYGIILGLLRNICII